MLHDTKAFSGFSSDDLDAAEQFYGTTLGLAVTRSDSGMLILHLAGDRDTLIYPKPNHEPASYTILNFPVDDVAATVAGLRERGVVFEQYPGMGIGEDGVFRGGGPLIAWFKDPAGNVLSIIDAADPA